MTVRVKFWGCRGSIACPSPRHLKYGGNTTCLEVTAGDHTFVLDAGTGVRNLGREILASDTKECLLLLTHTHWDHINGFPFFAPAFKPGLTFHILAGHLQDKGGVQKVFASQMDNPVFPVPLEAMQAKLLFKDFKSGEDLDLASNVTIRTAPLNHPNDATGYRIEHGGNSLCFITDTEHVPGSFDQNILDLVEGSDMMIYDSTYTEEEFVDHVGWGHSTWEEGVRLCKAANVKRLAIFHHDPDHDDVFMDALGEAAKAAWDRTFVVREGMDVTIG
jgi:phosphoribosyl 1,2-cyclic phosphodiesterase